MEEKIYNLERISFLMKRGNFCDMAHTSQFIWLCDSPHSISNNSLVNCFECAFYAGNKDHTTEAVLHFLEIYSAIKD